MLKRNKWKILATTLVTLLPILAGLILWDKLPERMPIHWGVSGEANGYAGRAVAVFALPGFMAAMHLLCVVATALDPKAEHHAEKVLDLVFCIVPVMSVFVSGMVYAAALGVKVDVGTWTLALCSVLFILIGNYLPKCRRNYTIGIKVPWTLDSDENWNVTHRFAGKVWVTGGFILLIVSFLPGELKPWIYVPGSMLMAVLPVCRSYLYYKSHST